MEQKPKNIVICSDGTGNAGGKMNGTNVWRLFLAIDHDPKDGLHQTAFYDDGLGTENLKYTRMVGGAFGWGISRNLTQMMGFLLRQYRPGDRLYLFGFSRGAFTIRVLANMIRLCGIPDCSGRTPDETNGCAAAALRAYKRRDPKAADGGGHVRRFRERYSVVAGTIDVQFIGVWDSVEALGLPFEEMKAGLRWLFRLRMREGERELYDNVRHARHALSVDDERLTFAPMVWDETDVDRDKTTVKQVWFPGVHSNVGGGYAKDQLALISLNWMMAEAHACGLRFYPDLWAEYRRDADVDGQAYDARAGLGFYYRYQPRRLGDLCAAKSAPVTLHESVLQRISLGTDDYAPDGVPQTYRTEPPVPDPATTPSELHPAARAAQLEVVQDVIWWRQVAYALFLAWTVAAVVLCWAYRTTDPVVDVGTWSFGERLAYHLLDPVLALVQWAMPAYFEPGVIAARHHPLWAGAFALALLGIRWANARLKRAYGNLTVKAWRASLPSGTHTPRAAATAPASSWWTSLGRLVRRNPLASFVRWLWMHIAPVVTVLGLAMAIAWVGARYLVPSFWLANNPVVADNPKAAEQLLRGAGPPPFEFDARRSLQPTPFVLTAGEKYRIRVGPITEPWMDDTVAAGPEGFESSHWVFRAFGQLRRDTAQPWFKLMGSVGPDLDAVFPIGRETYYRAPRTGRLYLYVNDTLLTYGNNQGRATVTVECVTPDAPFPSTRPATAP